MVEGQEVVKKSSEIAKESWSKPEFEAIGIEMTANGAKSVTIDSGFMS